MTRAGINIIFPAGIKPAILTALLGIVSFAYGQKALPEKTEQVPKIVQSGVVNGKALTLAKPEYPAAAKAAGVSGRVDVRVTIDELGNVIYAKAIAGPELLRDSAAAAALRSKFKPATLSNAPVKISGIIVYNFVPPNYEHKVAVMGLGIVLNLPEILNLDGEDDFLDADTVAEITQDLPFLAKELEPLNSVKNLAEEKRAQVLAEIAAKVEPKLTGPQVWQFAVGKRIAGAMAEMIRSVKNENYRIDESVLRSELLNLKELLKAPPADFPPPVLEKLKELAEMAEKENLASESNLKLILSKFELIFNTISPDEPR
jgi:TonB family protein